MTGGGLGGGGLFGQTQTPQTGGLGGIMGGGGIGGGGIGGGTSGTAGGLFGAKTGVFSRDLTVSGVNSVLHLSINTLF